MRFQFANASHQFRQDDARRVGQNKLNLPGQRGSLRVDLHDRCSLSQGVERQGCGRINKRRGADREENVTSPAGTRGLRQFRRRHRFLKPDDIGAQQSAAVRAPRRDRAGIGPRVNNFVFLEAFCAREVAVKFDDPPAASAVVQAVHVLGDESKLRKKPFHFHERPVGGIGLRGGEEFAAPFIPLPDEARVTTERARRGEVFGLVSCPQASLRVAERRHAAFGRNARAGEHSDTIGGGEFLDQQRRNFHARMM